MKKSFFQTFASIFFICVGFCVKAQADYRFIPDTNFVNFLQANFPASMNGDSLNINAGDVLGAAYLNVSQGSIENLSGIEYFTDLEYLDCSHNHIDSFGCLPSSLKALICGNQTLIIGPFGMSGTTSGTFGYNCTPANLETFDCSNNSLNNNTVIWSNWTNLVLGTSLKVLKCDRNSWAPMTLDLYNNSNIVQVSCQECGLFGLTLPITSTTTLPITIDCSNNPGLDCLPPSNGKEIIINTWNTSIMCIPDINYKSYNTMPFWGGYFLPLCDPPYWIWNPSCNTALITSNNPPPPITTTLWKFKNNALPDTTLNWNNRSKIQSQTVADGAWVLDADSLLSPSYSGSLNAPLVISLQGVNSGNYYLSFHQYYRGYNSSTTVTITTFHPYNGSTQNTTIALNNNVPDNGETANYDFQIIPFTSLGGNVEITFNYQGKGYFWIIDDIRVQGTYPSPTLPNPALGEFLYNNNTPYEVDANGHPYAPNQVVVNTTNPSPVINLPNGDLLQLLSSCDCDTLHTYEYIPQASLVTYPSPDGKSISIEERVKGAGASSQIDSDDPNYFIFSELTPPAVCGSPSLSPLTSTSAFPFLALDNTYQNYIAILDTGIDPTSQSLAEKIAVQNLSGSSVTNLFGWNLINNNNNPLDDHGHGTHVAGIINDVLNDYYPNGCNIKFKIYKTHNALGISTLFHATCGIYCAINDGAKVINYSSGYYVDSLENATILYRACQKAKNQGVMIVASAGNDGLNLDHPHLHIPSGFTAANLPAPFTSLDNVIAVGSTNDAGALAGFSNHSSTFVDIAAPGVSIVSNGICGTSSTRSGTSMTTGAISAGIANRRYCIVGADSSFLAVQNDVFNQCSYPTTPSQTVTGNSILYECCAAIMPSLRFTGDSLICMGNYDTLTVSGADQYLWSTGETTQTIVVKPYSPNSYTVTATHNNCTVTQIGSFAIGFDACRDFTPTIDIDNVGFSAASVGTTRDFVIHISEILNQPSVGSLVLKIPKMTGFSYSFPPTAILSNVYGGITVQNYLWTKTEDNQFITLTLNPGVVVQGYGITSIGMTISRNPNVPAQTNQPLSVFIVDDSGNDGVRWNNQYNIVVIAL